MKAIVHEQYGAFELLELRDIDKPAINDEQILVRSLGADHVIDYTREDFATGGP